VEDVMTSKVKIVKEDTPVNVVANIMVRNNVNRVPVLDNNGNLVGIITRADIVKSMV